MKKENEKENEEDDEDEDDEDDEVLKIDNTFVFKLLLKGFRCQ